MLSKAWDLSSSKALCWASSFKLHNNALCILHW